MTIKVIYITSLSHSGSTLLDLLLNAHSRIMSVGEIKQLPLKWRNLRRDLTSKRTPFMCCCGETVRNCAFWTQINQQVEITSGKSLSELDMKGHSENEFITDNEIIFRIIGDVSKTSFIVDSSKDVRRLSLLKRVPGIEVFPIVLVRDAKGQICSIQTKAARKGWRDASITGSIDQYNEINRKIQTLVKTMPHVKIRYEQLVTQPEITLMSILKPLGLNFEPQQLQWASQPKHLVAGNGMRWQTASVIKTDMRWKHHLSLPERICIDVGTLSSRYPFLGSLDTVLTRVGGSLLALNRMSARGTERRKSDTPK